VQRGLDAFVLKDFFSSRNYKGVAYNSVVEALDAAKKQAKNDDIIYVGGSTFVVAEII
jgi:dihydrofolate synthase/folylpolyglutamate synthase